MHEQQQLDRFGVEASSVVSPAVTVLYGGPFREWQVVTVVLCNGGVYVKRFGREIHSYFTKIALHRAAQAREQDPKPVYTVPQGLHSVYPMDYPGSDVHYGVAVGVASSDPSKDQLVAQLMSRTVYHFMSAQVQAILDQAGLSS